MPTVDDLVISLTIKETSKLGSLAKQLEAIVGKRGEKAPKFGFDKTIKTDLNLIKQRLTYLMPTEIPGSERPKAMAITAKIEFDLIDKYIKKYVEKLTPIDEKDVKNFAKGLGIPEEDLGKFLESKLRDWQYRLEEIMSETWTTPSAQRFLVRIDDLISRKEMVEGGRKTIFTSIENSISEFNAEVAQLLKKLGIFAIPEFSVFKMTEDVLSTIADDLGTLRLNMDELEKIAGITGSAEAEGAYKQIKNIANIISLKDPLKYIEQAFKTLGISKKDVQEKMFTEAGVMADPRLRAMIPSIIQVAVRRGEAPGIPRGFAQAIKTVVNKAVGGPGIQEQFYQYVRPDLLIISDELKILTDLVGPDIAKQITEGFFEFSEFKKILTQENADQFIKYKTYVGDRLFGLSSSIQESFKRFAPDILTAQINIMQELAKAGAIYKLTESQKEELIKEAQKGIGAESIKKFLTDLFQGLPIETFSKEEREKVYEYLHEIAGNLGVNPNWVDLPSFTQKIGDQVRDLRLQIEKINTIQSKELFNKMIELRDKLQVDIHPKMINDIISQLMVTYEEIKDMPIQEIEKREIRYEMMKAIVDMRMTEWKTLQEKYAQFPSIIIEGLEEIKNKTQEYQQQREAEWKKTLLGKMDELIKSVSDYRNELRTTIGRKYTEPKISSGYPEG